MMKWRNIQEYANIIIVQMKTKFVLVFNSHEKCDTSLFDLKEWMRKIIYLSYT